MDASKNAVSLNMQRTTQRAARCPDQETRQDVEALNNLQIAIQSSRSDKYTAAMPTSALDAANSLLEEIDQALAIFRTEIEAGDSRAAEKFAEWSKRRAAVIGIIDAMAAKITKPGLLH